ncbi:MAG: alpha/beta hydrolase [Burkholderiaceae bacterium]
MNQLAIIEPFDTRIPGLDPVITGSIVDNGNGLNVHVLQAGNEAGRPVVLLLHGFPELAYSWRKVMVPLANAGFHVIAPDQRGYGRTTGWSDQFDTDLTAFQLPNFVRDHVGLLHALGVSRVDAVVGHDYGSPVAAYCALIRPDLFKRVVLMSAPFGGPPSFGNSAGSIARSVDHEGLLALNPPREHYQWYYSGPDANDNMHQCAQGVHNFLRAYYHAKSADWPGNKPYRLNSWAAIDMGLMPTYYIMNKNDNGMAGTVVPYMPDAKHIAQCQWLPDSELAVYAQEYARTGFQGGLQSYRCATGGEQSAALRLYSKKAIEVPAMFISGSSDWGTYQKPGDFEAMQSTSCGDFRGCHLIDGAGHWVQQEQPAAVVDVLLPFIRGN